MIGRNQELHNAMLQKGYHYSKSKDYENFADKDGKYVPYPVGYIRGPYPTYGHSNRYPHGIVVKGSEDWIESSFKTITEATDWAVKEQNKILRKQNDGHSSKNV